MPHCPKSQDIRAQREPGQSGNPSGRPKGRSKDLDNFGDILMKEFFKTVPVSLVGKTVNKTQGEVLAMQMMKKAINGGTPERGLLLQFIEQHTLAKILGERGSHEQVRLDDQDAGIAHRGSPEDF
jgi:Family of unknown function (DUF5681)